MLLSTPPPKKKKKILPSTIPSLTNPTVPTPLPCSPTFSHPRQLQLQLNAFVKTVYSVAGSAVVSPVLTVIYLCTKYVHIILLSKVQPSRGKGKHLYNSTIIGQQFKWVYKFTLRNMYLTICIWMCLTCDKFHNCDLTHAAVGAPGKGTTTKNSVILSS